MYVEQVLGRNLTRRKTRFFGHRSRREVQEPNWVSHQQRVVHANHSLSGSFIAKRGSSSVRYHKIVELVQIYAPTTANDEDEAEKFYAELESTLY